MRTFLFPADLDDRVSTETGKSSPQVALEKKPWGKGFRRDFLPSWTSRAGSRPSLSLSVIYGLRSSSDIRICRAINAPLFGALYFLSGLGGSSVIVFFVLSGFLVGGIGLAKVKSQRFDTLNYAIDRFVRLFIVFIPALILILILNSVGNHFFGDTGLWNGSGALTHKNFSDFAKFLTLKDFFINLLMLQSFYGPYFGTGKPLWSLSYEFWFYVEFGLLATAILHGRAVRGACVALAGVVALFLGFRFLALLGTWLIGVAVSLYRGEKLRHPTLSVIVFVLSSFAMRFGALEGASESQGLCVDVRKCSGVWVGDDIN